MTRQSCTWRIWGVLALGLLSQAALAADTAETKDPGAAEASRAAKPPRIQWVKSVKAVNEQARASGKLIMVDFYTDWCPQCEILDRTSYQDSRVILLSEEVVPCRFDAEKEGAQLAKTYQVNGYPTIIFIDAEGQVVDKVAGRYEPRDYVRWMAKVLTKQAGARLEKEAADRPEDPVIQAKLAVILISQWQEEAALQYFNKAEAAEAKNPSGRLAPAYQAFASYYFERKNPAQAVPYLKKYIETTKAGDVVPARLLLSQAYLEAGEAQEAVKELKSILEMPEATKKQKQLARQMLEQAGAPAGGTGENKPEDKPGK